ncbi:hypothetical protein PHMEG_00018238 [Phytophthora megakarya]|uniref:Uncharacterized protein n=1 Tax=Phytophthora megakarya TaxID=4795 RepID=A0A225VUK4_9STRA|nr:hypothetical protein PHMEG_00018238 [Phytophthora megakarya]
MDVYLGPRHKREPPLSITSLGRKSFGLLMDRFALYYAIPLYRPKGGRPLEHGCQILNLSKEMSITGSTNTRTMDGTDIS